MSDEGWCAGVVTCEKCGESHVSVWPATVERQECPNCHHMTQSTPSEQIMTPEELHSRILLHEIRTILLDETREGDQLPEERKQILRDDPHSSAPYLILADWLEDQGSDLGELCRIQVELIGVIPADQFARRHDEPQHHFWIDRQHFKMQVEEDEHALALTQRRLEIAQPLYPPKECSLSHRELLARRGDANWHGYVREWIATRGIDLSKPYESREDAPGRRMVYTQSRRLGRTTRMLTDVLRYCCLNQGKNVLVRVAEVGDLRERFESLMAELIDLNPDQHVTPYMHFPFKSPVLITRLSSTYWPLAGEPDITFTDHACPQPPVWDDQVRRRQMLALLQERGRIDYAPSFNPAVFINPDNL